MNQHIVFNKPFVTEDIIDQTHEIIKAQLFNTRALDKTLEAAFRKHVKVEDTTRLFFTQSATQALEMMALAIGLGEGDEVIMPSYTYAATANAFARLGVKIVFADMEVGTMNLSAATVEPLISDRTRAVVPIHYGGNAAELSALMALSKKYGFLVLEDAAHGIGASYQSQPLGSIGHMGCLSFHHTKNINAGGSGGVLMVNTKAIRSSKLITMIEEIYQQGTNRHAFINGEVKSYHWQRLGGEYEMSAFSKAFLTKALPNLQSVTEKRVALWHRYFTEIKDSLARHGLEERVRLPIISSKAAGNGHIFQIILDSAETREAMISAMAKKGIDVYTHYEPLHLSLAGKRYGVTRYLLDETRKIANGLIRLPLYEALTFEEQDRVIEALDLFFSQM